MPSDDVPVAVDDRSFANVPPYPFQNEFCVILPRDETDVLTFPFSGDGQFRLSCNPPNLLLAQTGKREENRRQRRRRHPIEKIRLILLPVQRPPQKKPSALRFDRRIVPRRQVLESGCPALLEQNAEFQGTIAFHARVRRSSPGVLSHERIDHALLQGAGKIETVMRDAERPADAPRILDGIGTAASCPAVSRGRYPQAHGCAHDVVSRIFQKKGGHGRVNPAAHRHHDLPASCHRPAFMRRASTASADALPSQPTSPEDIRYRRPSCRVPG